MTKLIIIALLVIAVAVLAGWALILKGKEDMLAKRETAFEYEKEKFKTEYDIYVANRKTLETLVADYAPWVNGTATELNAAYVVTDSDLMKYNSESAIKNVARNRIAHNIACDIIKKFPEPIVYVENGKTKYYYKFKLMEDK